MFRTLTVTIVAATVLAGCGSSTPKAAPATTATPATVASTTPKPTPPATPIPPTRPADTRTETSAIAYAEYALKTLFYGALTHNADPLLALANGDECAGCIKFAQSLDPADAKFTYRLTAPLIYQPATIGDQSDDQYLVLQTVTVPGEGTKTNTVTGAKGKPWITEGALDYRVVVIWKGNQWRLNNFSSKNSAAR